MDLDDWGEDDDEHALRGLDPLVSHVAEETHGGDLVVLCVTGVLRSIPLHALWVDGEPLFERNPVVYAASMTSFAHCYQRSLNRHPVPHESMAVMAVYEEEVQRDSPPTSNKNVYNAARDVASATGASIFGRHAGTINSYLQPVQACSCFPLPRPLQV